MPQLIDIHGHIQFSAFKDDADEVIQRAINSGVYIIAPSSQLSTSKRAILYAEKYPGKVFAAVGLHPIHLKPAKFDPSEGEAPAFETHGDQFDEKIWRLLAEHEKVVALGEVGLDYIDRLELSEKDRDIQEETFRKEIELALSVNKPIIQHCRSGLVAGNPRDAHDDALRIIANCQLPTTNYPLRGVAHCYSGNVEQAKQYLDLGFYLSFTGLITFNNSWDEVIKMAPLERLMVETDCPYMTPVPHRGKRNEPSFVRYMAEKIAELKGLPFEKVAEQTTENARKLFELPFA